MESTQEEEGEHDEGLAIPDLEFVLEVVGAVRSGQLTRAAGESLVALRLPMLPPESLAVFFEAPPAPAVR
jgi:hypothetical protein